MLLMDFGSDVSKEWREKMHKFSMFYEWKNSLYYIMKIEKSGEGFGVVAHKRPKSHVSQYNIDCYQKITFSQVPRYYIILYNIIFNFPSHSDFDQKFWQCDYFAEGTPPGLRLRRIFLLFAIFASVNSILLLINPIYHFVKESLE